jgi:hypothetical protein
MKAFLVIQELPGSEYDVSVLKVFVNQAELVYRALRKDVDFSSDVAPLEQVEVVTRNVKGEIE